MRTLPKSYVPGKPIVITIKVTLAPQVSAYAIEDFPPKNWVVGKIDNEGGWDLVNKKVKWLILDKKSRTLSYTVTPLIQKVQLVLMGSAALMVLR